MTVDEFFEHQAESRQIFEALNSLVKTFGPVELHVTKSQVAFHRRKAFAWVWMPGMYLHRKTAPLVLTLSFHKRDPSLRWKEIVEPYPGRFTHHLELYAVNEIDDEVRNWLWEAWVGAV